MKGEEQYNKEGIFQVEEWSIIKGHWKQRVTVQAKTRKWSGEAVVRN